MFLLDSSVLSTLVTAQSPPAVAVWVSSQPPGLLFTSAICQAEILSGLAIMPAGRRRAGRPAATVDLMIAGIARSHGASVVTRNVADFDECGVLIVSPWGA